MRETERKLHRSEQGVWILLHLHRASLILTDVIKWHHSGTWHNALLNIIKSKTNGTLDENKTSGHLVIIFFHRPLMEKIPSALFVILFLASFSPSEDNMHHELLKMLFNVLTWSWGFRLVNAFVLILLCIIFLFYLSDWWVCLLHDCPKMVKGLSASVPLWNPAIVSLKVITLNRSRSDLYEGKKTCPKLIKEQPHTKPLVILLLNEWVPWPLGDYFSIFLL